MRKSLNLALACAVALSIAPLASASFINNGNFETPGSNPLGTNTFAWWAELNNTGAAAQEAGSAVTGSAALAGTTSARVPNAGGWLGNDLPIAITGAGTSYTVSLLAASTAPAAGTRSLNVLVRDGLSAAQASPQINLRVFNDGTTNNLVQAFSGSWITIPGLSFNYSTDLDAAPVVNTITVTGTLGGSYVVNVNGTNSTPVSFFQSGTGLNSVGSVLAVGSLANVPYTIDNVSVVPEPTTLAAGAIIGLLALRRRPH